MKRLICIFSLFSGILFLTCGDPLSDQDKIIRTLLSGPMESGEYSVFWDGTDDRGKCAGPGTYIAMLFTRDFTLIDTLTALPGTDDKYNKSEYFNSTPQLMDEMTNNEPDPFHIEDGTNVHFVISTDISARLTIRKPDNK